jgi:hypothetical protein
VCAALLAATVGRTPDESTVRGDVTQDRVIAASGKLAMAYVECGRFAEAIETTQRAQQLAKKWNQRSVADFLNKKIEMYQSRQPYRDQLKVKQQENPGGRTVSGGPTMLTCVSQNYQPNDGISIE